MPAQLTNEQKLVLTTHSFNYKVNPQNTHGFHRLLATDEHIIKTNSLIRDTQTQRPRKTYLKKNALLGSHTLNHSVLVEVNYLEWSYKQDGSYHMIWLTQKTYRKEANMKNTIININRVLNYNTNNELVGYEDSSGNLWKKAWGLECPFVINKSSILDEMELAWGEIEAYWKRLEQIENMKVSCGEFLILHD